MRFLLNKCISMLQINSILLQEQRVYFSQAHNIKRYPLSTKGIFSLPTCALYFGIFWRLTAVVEEVQDGMEKNYFSFNICIFLHRPPLTSSAQVNRKVCTERFNSVLSQLYLVRAHSHKPLQNHRLLLFMLESFSLPLSLYCL